MPIKARRSLRRRLIKIFLVIVTIFILGFIALYIWFVHNSNDLLIDLVNQRSGGRLKLELAHVSFNFIDNEVKIYNAKIISTKKNSSPITYQVSFRKVTLHTSSIWSLLFNSSPGIRQIKVFDPVIEVYNNRKGNPADSINTLSIGKELGKIYSSIQDGITALHTHSIYIINATLILNNKMAADNKQIVFSNIYFTLKKLHKFNKATGGYLENNTIDFSSSNQAITLSDGIHRLLFKKLSIKQARSIVLDSCTIIALPVHGSGGSYTINFEKLALVGVDFKALYTKNLIKADSVYCINPVSDIRLTSKTADSSTAAKGLPDLEKIIKVFSGNLDLGFVGVTNAAIHLDIKGKKSLSNVHSGKLNFQIQHLRIDPDSSQLVSISDFAMMVKGYQLYNSDSTCVYAFDSIRFANDKLVLNNVSVHTSSGKNKIRNYRDYTIPHFELSGINWSELIFRQNLQATEAVLYDPTINFIKTKQLVMFKKPAGKPRHTFDDFLGIDKFTIVNGTLNIKWDVNTSLQLMGLDLGISGDNITDYKQLHFNEGIESLFFASGILKTGDISAQLRNVIFRSNDQVHAEELLIENKKEGIESKINDVSINHIYPGKNSGIFVIDGLKWNGGAIALHVVNGVKEKHTPSSILIKNMQGKQTHFQITNNNLTVSALVNDVQIDSLFKDKESPIAITGLQLNGGEVNVSNGSIEMKAATVNLSDDSQKLGHVSFEKNDSVQRVLITMPYLQVTSDINNFFTKIVHFQDVTLQSPVIDFQRRNTSPSFSKNPLTIPALTIDHIHIKEPLFNLQMPDSPGKVLLISSFPSGEIKMDDIQTGKQDVSIGSVQLQTGKVSVSRNEEKIVEVDGSNASLKNCHFSASANHSWDALLTRISLQNADGFTFKVKQNTISLKDITIGNLSVTSSSIKNIAKLLDANPGAWASTSSVKYVTKNSLWQTDHVQYDENAKTIKVDSITYQPLLSRDSTIAINPYQTDYISFNSGSAVLSGIDLVTTFSDNSISVQKAVFDHPSINVYRDKLPPFLEGVRKPLFTEKIKAINMPLTINEVIINEGKASYIEKTNKSRLEGNVILTHLNGSISNIKNSQLQAGDSFSLSVTGRLLEEAHFSVQLRQSYRDPLYGFLLNLKMQPASLMILNPLLEPLSNVKFVTGKLDKLEMNVIGNENAAHGKMKFYYHGLRIKLLENGSLEEKRFLRGAESDLVNFFFLKNNNTKRTGLVYFERLKDRSFFNYINKIIFSGVGTSVGAFPNSKYRKLSRKNKLSTFE